MAAGPLRGPSLLCVAIFARLLGAFAATHAPLWASHGLDDSRDWGALLLAGLATACLLAAAALAAAAAVWEIQNQLLKRLAKEGHSAQLERRCGQGTELNTATLCLLEQAPPTPLVDTYSGLISPFASILPILEAGDDDECRLPGPGDPLPPLTFPTLAPAASAPAPGWARQAGQQGIWGPLEEQQSLSFAAARASLPLPLQHKQGSLASSVGSWVASLLGRGSSGLAEEMEGEVLTASGAWEGGGRPPQTPGRPAQAPGHQPQLQPAEPPPPLPIRKRGSLESLASARSSDGCLPSLLGGALAGGGQDAPAGAPSAGLAMTESSLLSESLGALQLSDWWEVSPDEIEILKRPDGSDWELGAGGFGKVYKALRNGVTPVAVKVLAGGSSEAQEVAVSEFCREIAILRACKDPHVVSFLGACLNNHATMLVTEYCEGGSLTRNIMRGRVRWYSRGRKIAVDVARGLAFLHSRRIVHFDLKSPNILVTRNWEAKIADVGMAKVIGRDYSAVSGCLGTLAWAAPEMLLGARCTHKADIFSFGVVLWEIVTGEVPQRGQLRDVRTPEECPAEVRELILECLDPSPKNRPTAVQLVERLQAMPPTPPVGQRQLQQQQQQQQQGEGTHAAGRRGVGARRLPSLSVEGPGAHGHMLPQPQAKAVSAPALACVPGAAVPAGGGEYVGGPATPRGPASPTGASLAFPEAPLPSSPFAAAAASPAAGIAAPGPGPRPAGEPAGQGRPGARPPRPPPTPVSPATGSARRGSGGVPAGARGMAQAASLPIAQEMTQGPAEPASSSPWDVAAALHNCLLFPVLSQRLERQHSSPAVMGSQELPPLGEQPLGTTAGQAHRAAASQQASLPHLSSPPALGGVAAMRRAARPAVAPGLAPRGSSSSSSSRALHEALVQRAAATHGGGEGPCSPPDDVWGRLLFNM